ncbi:MAG: copper-translocating P-type ATPase [Candidatus Bathyarchaeia archaeon]
MSESVKREDKEDGDHGGHIRVLRRKFIISTLASVPILLLSETIQGWLRFRLTLPFQGYILLALSLFVYLYGGLPFLKGMLVEVGNRQPGMMTLIGTAISIAFFYSAATVVLIQGMDFFWELATLIDVMLLGHWIEARSVMGASRALEELVKIMPTTAHKLVDGETRDVPVRVLQVGDIVIVRPGEKIPSDGVVVDGESYVNESLITGESKPVEKHPGAEVIGGSINNEGSLEVRIQRTGEETYLSQVIEMVREAQGSRSETQNLADRSAALLFYIAMAASAVTYVAWNFSSTTLFALERAVTVLVIACPHALGLAIPLVVALSTTITAQKGILIRDRTAFEGIREVDVIVFDKTGTLTKGEFGVTDVYSLGSEDEFLRLSASIERYSEHIIAQSIYNYAEERLNSIPEADEFRALPGRGVMGSVEGHKILIGSPRLMEERGIDIDLEEIDRMRGEGKTVVFTVADGVLIGAFALADQIKEESYEAVEQLETLGYRVYMITGDAKSVAESVAKELGIDDYFAEVLPEKKAKRIRDLKEEGYSTAMVGDGINDAPALVTADVGVAIGAGTDVAIESADIILVKNNPADVVKAIDLSDKTYEKMVQNLWWAAGYNVVAIPLAAGVLSSYGIVLTPAVGAILMSLSTVIVALNSQTLRRYK